MYFSPDLRVGVSRRECPITVALLLAGMARGEELRKIRPPHDVSRDPGLAAFMQRMRTIAGSRASVALERLMGPTFRVEFDRGKGPATFARYWHPESRISPVWSLLERLLAQGGVFYSATLFALPYTVANFPFDLDPLTHVVAVRRDVALIAEPRPGARSVASLDLSILPLAQPLTPPVFIPPGRYLEAEHPRVGRCFVLSDDVYSPAAHRAFFEKRHGVWRWISLAAATLADPPDLVQGQSGRDHL
jgi:hypothetical protein